MATASPDDQFEAVERALVELREAGAPRLAELKVELLGRKLRIKASAGWIHYKVDAEGLVVNAMCPVHPIPGFADQAACTDWSPVIADPPTSVPA